MKPANMGTNTILRIVELSGCRHTRKRGTVFGDQEELACGQRYCSSGCSQVAWAFSFDVLPSTTMPTMLSSSATLIGFEM